MKNLYFSTSIALVTGITYYSAVYRPFAEFKRSPSSIFESEKSHLQRTRDANRRILKWYDRKAGSLQEWMARRGEAGGPPDFLDFSFPETKKIPTPSADEAKIALETKRLYDEYFPPSDPSSYIGTFFESGHPSIQTARGPYQWNSMEAAGVERKEKFDEVVETLSQKNHIKSFRLGPNIHQVSVSDPTLWGPFIEKIETIWMNGGTPTISMAFFPSLKAWEVKKNGEIDFERSYLLHPQWPSDMGKLSKDMMETLWKRAAEVEKKLGKRVNVVINPVNEPETLAGFNRHFWHGAHANWGSPETMKFYIPSIIQIAKANVEIRLAVEAASKNRRVLFMHNEAMTPTYYPSHQGGGRFAISKFMLGDDLLLKKDFDFLGGLSLAELRETLSPGNEVHWALENFVFGSWNKSPREQEAAQEKITRLFAELKGLHLKLHEKTQKTMRTDNMLLLDYYYQTEFIPGESMEAFATRMGANDGAALKEVLGTRTDESFVRMVREAATSNASDLPPEGPKGPVLKFTATKRSEIDFEKLLRQEDYVVLERLVGFRREYSFKSEEPYAQRQKDVGLRPLKSQLYRTDHIRKSLVGRVIFNDIDRSDLHEYLGMRRNYLLGFEPQHYARQIKAGIRQGFYGIMTDYVSELRIFTAGVGESGTPFFVFAPLLHDQVMMEYALALKSGIYGTQYAFGPAVDTRGWAKAPLGLHYDDDHDLNPSGLYNLESGVKPWVNQFLDPFYESLQEGH